MIFTSEYVVGLEQIGFNNEVTNRALLSMMEDIASLHSASVGFGVLDVEKSRKGWVLLNWKVKVIRRPKYNETIYASTWSRRFERAFACRDFEFKDAEGNVMVIGTSKWVLFDIDTRKPQRLTDEIGAPYQSEPDRCVFEDEITDVVYDKESVDNADSYMYDVMRRDIDINGHMHNINYVDIASEALPQEVYEAGHWDEISVSYKREIKHGDKVDCRYVCNDGRHIVAMLVDGKVNAVVELKSTNL